MNRLPAIRAARDEDTDDVGDLIARSFDHLGANRYLVPDDSERLPVMRRFFQMLSEHAQRGAGRVLYTGDAVAVWFDRTTEGPGPVEYDERLADITGKHLDRFLELDHLLDLHHPSAPHWHLAFLAVDPHLWGRGRGTALLNYMHAQLDETGTAAYLEASDLESRRLYLRHGYTDMVPPQFTLDDGTPFYRMWRPAQPH